jgi:hypothetical protein
VWQFPLVRKLTAEQQADLIAYAKELYTNGIPTEKLQLFSAAVPGHEKNKDDHISLYSSELVGTALKRIGFLNSDPAQMTPVNLVESSCFHNGKQKILQFTCLGENSSNDDFDYHPN